MRIEELLPPFPLPVRSLCLRCPISSFEFDQVSLASVDEVATFAVEKRRREHLTGRWLLAQALDQWGVNSNQIEVKRTELRAPVLSYLPGVWLNTPLPSISIGHAADWAYVALIEHDWSIGIDAEPADRGIAENAFDLMARGEELDWLRQNPSHAIELWTSKESIQKALQMGMHLNPRKIEIPIGEGIRNISIEKSIIQLENWNYDGVNISVAWHDKPLRIRTPEDDLLDATVKAMQEQEWGVGCKITLGKV
tara:strand:- start:836 stop:1591 length:756 start_codon:yes stop_codon:yes gene_type:complete